MYHWQEPQFPYRRSTNNTYNLTETIADYFNAQVLQRSQIRYDYVPRRIETGGVRLQV